MSISGQDHSLRLLVKTSDANMQNFALRTGRAELAEGFRYPGARSDS